MRLLGASYLYTLPSTRRSQDLEPGRLEQRLHQVEVGWFVVDGEDANFTLRGFAGERAL